MPDPIRLAARGSLWLVLGGWIGAGTWFALVVARAVFRLLPTSEAAGRLVDAVYTPLQLYGMAAGLVLAALTLALGRSRWLAVHAAVLSGLCFISHFGITVRLDELRDRAFGASPQAEASREFMALHGWSMALHAAVLVGAILLVFLHVAAELRAERRSLRAAPGGPENREIS
jgi:hypothetical protein